MARMPIAVEVVFQAMAEMLVPVVTTVRVVKMDQQATLEEVSLQAVAQLIQHGLVLLVVFAT